MSHTPPNGTPTSLSQLHSQKRNRSRGPRCGTLERQDGSHTWGGRRRETTGPPSEDELSSSLNSMGLAGSMPRSLKGKAAAASSLGSANSDESLEVRPPPPRRSSGGGRSGVRRLRCIAALEANGIIDARQQNAIKDLLILGDHQGRKRVIQRRFNVGVLEAMSESKASTL